MCLFPGNCFTFLFRCYTPLHIAASIGCDKCIEVLLKYGADVTKMDEFGKTPHDTATLNYRKNAAMLLKTAGE